MPWLPAQHRLFQAAASNPAIVKAHGVPMGQPSQMAGPGIAPPPQPSMLSPVTHKAQMLAVALKRMK